MAKTKKEELVTLSLTLPQAELLSTILLLVRGLQMGEDSVLGKMERKQFNKLREELDALVDEKKDGIMLNLRKENK